MCNLGNDVMKHDSSAKSAFYGACCTPDDKSEFCLPGSEGGVTNNTCSPLASIWAAVPPIWYAACPIP